MLAFIKRVVCVKNTCNSVHIEYSDVKYSKVKVGIPDICEASRLFTECIVTSFNNYMEKEGTYNKYTNLKH